jgi:hypothetical protein
VRGGRRPAEQPTVSEEEGGSAGQLIDNPTIAERLDALAHAIIICIANRNLVDEARFRAKARNAGEAKALDRRVRQMIAQANPNYRHSVAEWRAEHAANEQARLAPVIAELIDLVAAAVGARPTPQNSDGAAAGTRTRRPAGHGIAESGGHL